MKMSLFVLYLFILFYLFVLTLVGDTYYKNTQSSYIIMEHD